MGKDIEAAAALSCSSSIDSSHPRPPFLISNSNSVSSSSSSSSSVSNNINNLLLIRRKDLSTDLKLGLSITSNNNSIDVSSTSNTLSLRDQRLDWPPIKPLLRSTLAEREDQQLHGGNGSLFVKVYMEGIPIGRKLDLFAHPGYNALITTLCHMFRTTILFHCTDRGHHHHRVHSCDKDKHYHVHVLTYEDKEGDWMMVGDVPWEMFLTTVKRLKITRADEC